MDLSKRINRIIGQLKGVGKMVKDKRDCLDTLQQISAIKKAVDGLSKEIVVFSICKTVSKSKTKKVEKMIKRVIDL